MAIKDVKACICDICRYMIQADKDKIAQGWTHRVHGNLDICPRCSGKLSGKPRREPVSNDTKSELYKSTRYSSGRYPWGTEPKAPRNNSLDKVKIKFGGSDDEQS